MEWCSPLYLGVVAIENGAFGSASTTVANFTYYIYVYYVRIYILDWYIYIYVIMKSRWRHGFPWLSLAICSYYLSLLDGLPGSI